MIKLESIRLIINIEAQNDFYPGYPLIKRGIYYCSRMISAQYGTEFTSSHYEYIKKVYSIWICMNPPKNRENSITRYYIAGENLVGSVKERKADYDLMAVVMICLGKEDDAGADVLKLLNVLLSTEMDSRDKCQILEEDFHIRMTQSLESEVSLMCNLYCAPVKLAVQPDCRPPARYFLGDTTVNPGGLQYKQGCGREGDSERDSSYDIDIKRVTDRG